MSRFITGTLKELTGAITLNGKSMTYPELVLFSKVLNGKAFKQVGSIKTVSEVGRPTIIWEVDTEVAIWFEPVEAEVEAEVEVAKASVA